MRTIRCQDWTLSYSSNMAIVKGPSADAAFVYWRGDQQIEEWLSRVWQNMIYRMHWPE